jgi:hypothetical protein
MSATVPAKRITDSGGVDPTLEFTAADVPSNPIENFSVGDNILIEDFAATGESYSGGVLTLTGAGGPINLAISGPGISSLADFNFSVDTNAHTTEIDTTPCYCPGTLIQTKRGQKKIEKLKIGDKVKTISGAERSIKWIGRRSYNGRFVIGRKDILPVCVKAGAIAENVPRRDLWISPHHAMYLEGVLIEAKDLVNDVSIVQADRVEQVEYFHIELDTHDVIIAEGALSESFIDDDSRGMFHNAHEYRILYPKVPQLPARYCAPRCDDGYEVEAARRHIATRAGLHSDSDEQKLALRGYVDVVSTRLIAGWAQTPEHPEAPVCLSIYAGDRLIGQVLANRYRADLERAGLGSGRHSFEFTPPAGLTFALHAVEVRRSLDRAALTLSTYAMRVRERERRACTRPVVRDIASMG